MTAHTLIETLFKHSGELHPNYTPEQHKLWTMGFLASIVEEKYKMDSIVWNHIKARLNELHTPTKKEVIIRAQ